MDKKFTWALLLFLLADLIYSFLQHVHGGLDGDLSLIVLPAEWYSHVLEDPFGMSVILEGKTYPGTNRFFAHWSLRAYFQTMPFLLQRFSVSPVDSLFLASGIAKIIMQIGLVWGLATCITGSPRIWRKDFLLAAVLVCPLFVTRGYAYFVGVIIDSITYSFFYSFAMLLVMFFFLPFILALRNNRPLRLHAWQHIALLLLAILLPLHGPLNFAVILLGCPALLLVYWLIAFRDQTTGGIVNRGWLALHRVPWPALVYFSLAIGLSLYSFYLGQFNTESRTDLSVAERYQLLGPGIVHFFSGNLVLPPLLGVIVLNAFILSRKYTVESKWLLKSLGWILIFTIVYICLLPLGGYRSYRPEILRSDSIMPVTLCLFFAFGATTLHIIKQQLTPRSYLLIPCLVIGLYLYTDEFTIGPYKCERTALLELAASKEEVVHLKADCSVLSWGPVWDIEFSTYNTRMLQYWKVLKEPKKYTVGPY